MKVKKGNETDCATSLLPSFLYIQSSNLIVCLVISMSFGSENHNLKEETIKKQYEVVRLDLLFTNLICVENFKVLKTLWTGKEAYLRLEQL